MPDRKKTVYLWSPWESNLFTFFAKIFFLKKSDLEICLALVEHPAEQKQSIS